MRHIISFILIVCLLHTQSYHAAADTMYVQQIPREKVASDYSMQQKIIDLNQLESGGIISEVKMKIAPSELVASLKQNVDVLKESIDAFMDSLPGFLTVFFTGIVLFGSSIFLFAFGFVAWVDDLPFHVVFSGLTHASLSEFQPLDVFQNFLADPNDLKRTQQFSHYEHASGDKGVLYTEALPHWINNANNILTMISDRILAERSSGGRHIHRSNEFEQLFKKLLYVNAGNMKNNYSCAFKIGNSSDHDVITECQEDFQPDIYYSVAQIPDNADALIQFRRWNKKSIIKSFDDILVRLSVKPHHPNSQRYPELDYTPTLNVDDVEINSMRRRLLQSDNPLTLSVVLQDRVSNNLDIMAQLNLELSRRRVLESINQTAISELLTLVGLVFKTNHIALTSDVGCNVSSTNGIFKLVSCFEGVASDIPAASPAADKEQVWFVRNRENSLSQVKIIAYTLPLEAFIAPWLKQSTQVMDNLWRVANTLRQRECNTTSDEHLDQLMAAAQHELANHGAYLQGDIGCDIQFNEMGAEMIQCQNETAPEIKGCDLESNVAVRKNAKLWFSSNVWSAGEIGSVAVSIHPFWQGSVSKTLPQSESNDISNSLILTDSQPASNSIGHEATSSIPQSVSKETSHSSMLSDSNELSHEATLSESEATFSESEKSSKSLTAEISDSLSGIVPFQSHTVSQPNVTTDGITELYYANGYGEVRKAFFNATHSLNDTLFLSNASFGAAPPVFGLYVDSQSQKIYWSTNRVAYAKNIYVSDIVPNPTHLNNTRVIYSASTSVGSLYFSKTANRIFWTSRGISMGIVNITDPINITSQSIENFNDSTYGLYYDSQTESLLWTTIGGYPSRAVIYKSTLNLQTAMLMNTMVLYNDSSSTSFVSYDVKNQRVFSTLLNEQICFSPFSFTNPMSIKNITQTSNLAATSPPYALSVVND